MIDWDTTVAILKTIGVAVFMLTPVLMTGFSAMADPVQKPADQSKETKSGSGEVDLPGS